MKKCIHCGSDIDEDATYCSFCNKEQKSSKNVILIILILISISLIVGILLFLSRQFIDKPNASSNNSGERRVEKIDAESSNLWYKLENESKTDTSYEITGYILNKNDKSVNNVKVLFVCYDDNDYVLGVIQDKTESIEVNAIWQFNVKYEGKADRCIYDELEISK